MKIEIDDNIYKEFKKVMKAKEISWFTLSSSAPLMIHVDSTRLAGYKNNEEFFKTKLQKLANQLIENEIKRHKTHRK